MQELAFPETSEMSTDFFDDYKQVSAAVVPGNPTVFICIFARTDANGKHHYMVAERWPIFDEERQREVLILHNAKEFKHAKDRAYRYFNTRKIDLASRD